MIGLFLALLPATISALTATFSPTQPDDAESPAPDKKEGRLISIDPVTTRHSVKTAAKKLDYDATFATMPIVSEDGVTEATLSYTYYRLADQTGKANRPLMFLFNGGPGSSSVWLHLGGLGPRRVKMAADGGMLPPPFRTIENPHTWLDLADLVFVDPVDTGFSRAATPELTKKFLAVDGDLELNSEFVRRFLSRYQRWHSPLFLGGESYGTFRSAGLAGKLIEIGVAFNGVILISNVLELGTLLFESGDDLPFVLYLPAYTATAWYHHRMPEDLQAKSLQELLPVVEAWALDGYARALAAGTSISDSEREAVITELMRFTGLPRATILECNLRIDGQTFCRKLLGEAGQVVGRLDSRHIGFEPARAGEAEGFDPSMSAIRAPFTAALNTYLRQDLGYEGEHNYHILRSLDWGWGDAAEGTPRTNTGLETALSRNPYLHVLVTSGYYDLATPYFATHYTFRRLLSDPATRDQIRLLDYPGGHMTYVALPLMAQMHDDVAKFVRDALAAAPRPLPS